MKIFRKKNFLPGQQALKITKIRHFILQFVIKFFKNTTFFVHEIITLLE